MNVSSRWMMGVCGVLLAVGALVAASERPTPRLGASKPLSALMLAKSATTQKIVSGLVREDFDEIRSAADELSRICDATEWVGHSDPIYNHHRTELRRQANKLIKLAGDKNLDGVTYTSMHALTTCISCHQHCRDVLKIAEGSRQSTRVIPIPVTDEIPMPMENQ